MSTRRIASSEADVHGDGGTIVRNHGLAANWRCGSSPTALTYTNSPRRQPHWRRAWCIRVLGLPRSATEILIRVASLGVEVFAHGLTIDDSSDWLLPHARTAALLRQRPAEAAVAIAA